MQIPAEINNDTFCFDTDPARQEQRKRKRYTQAIKRERYTEQSIAALNVEFPSRKYTYSTLYTYTANGNEIFTKTERKGKFLKWHRITREEIMLENLNPNSVYIYAKLYL
jgi:hypothetical protein